MKTQELAVQYAKQNGYDIVTPVVTKNGYVYYRVDWKDKPCYTGHPHIIKIRTNQAKKVVIVTDLDEIYWAVGLINTTDRQKP